MVSSSGHEGCVPAPEARLCNEHRAPELLSNMESRKAPQRQARASQGCQPPLMTLDLSRSSKPQPRTTGRLKAECI